MTYSCKIFELPFDIYATKLGRKRKVVRHLPLGSSRPHETKMYTFLYAWRNRIAATPSFSCLLKNSPLRQNDVGKDDIRKMSDLKVRRICHLMLYQEVRTDFYNLLPSRLYVVCNRPMWSIFNNTRGQLFFSPNNNSVSFYFSVRITY